MNLFDKTTGECLLSCGGDAADGHKKNCPAVKFEAENAALRERVAALEAERDDYKSKWQYVEKLNAALVEQNDELLEALERFAIENPIGVSQFWLDDIRNACNVVSRIKESR